jgi:hypothetical protein
MQFHRQRLQFHPGGEGLRRVRPPANDLADMFFEIDERLHAADTLTPRPEEFKGVIMPAHRRAALFGARPSHLPGGFSFAATRRALGGTTKKVLEKLLDKSRLSVLNGGSYL